MNREATQVWIASLSKMYKHISVEIANIVHQKLPFHHIK